MQYNHQEIEEKWQKYWAENQTFKAKNPPPFGELEGVPKYYVLDMFPYPSGAGLHVGHPLGYIASDIYARYKRHKGFNVLHPQGYDSFGLPAEQYAIQTGQHPAKTTEENIKTYRKQLDKIGFSFDWDREVRTSDPEYYKWTQWIFIQLFESYYCKDSDKARPISELEEVFALEGNSNINAVSDEDVISFSADEWRRFSSTKKQEILLQYRLTYLSDTEVNWCPALGTVLANDEIVNGVSERGGHPVVRKKMTQWSMRISAYAQRLLDGLEKIDWPQPLKDAQTNWIGRSQGAMVSFPILSFPKGEEKAGYMTGGNYSYLLLERAKEMRANPTQAEAILWQQLKGKKIGDKFRQQHLIDDFIVDFVCLRKNLIIEVDGKYHHSTEQIEKDKERTKILEDLGYHVIRFTNEQVIGHLESVLKEIKEALAKASLSAGKGLRDRIEVYTTRPDTIFGVSFMTLAPEHELVNKITTQEQKAEVEAYIEATAKRSERDRMADVKSISGVFTGAYALHPFTGEKIPIWIGDYVLASYGTGAVMAVPCGDQRDYDFAKHFDIPIPNIFKAPSNSPEGGECLVENQAYSSKEGFVLMNSDFLNGLSYEEATKRVISELEKRGIGYGKINYRLRDAVFSRQRYWGEPFPVYYKDGLPQMIDPKHLPIVLPEVDNYLPTEDGKPPLGRAKKWYWLEYNGKGKTVTKEEFESSSSRYIGTGGALELNTMPGWAGSSWYFNRYMDATNEGEFASKEALHYWKEVDLYIGGSEHATGHLLYARFWQKFLFDRGYVPVDEFAKKLINQGMILGTSAFVYRFMESGAMSRNTDVKDLDLPNYDDLPPIIVSGDFYEKYLDFNSTYYSINNRTHKDKFKGNKISDQEWKPHENFLVLIENEIYNAGKKGHFIFDENSFQPIRIDLSYLENPKSDNLVISKFKKDNKFKEFSNGLYINGTGNIIDNDLIRANREPEKMSKSKYNVVNPDDIVKEYGADSLRLFEMFLGPLEQAKPWKTSGISGVYSFLKKLWKLFHTGENETFSVDSSPPSERLGEAKVLHKTIKKVEEDIENFSFNTSVSTFMIAVNELTALKCNKRAILEPLLILISPYAPHIAEELWSKLGHSTSISTAPFPKFEEKYLVESAKNYPISFNGKKRFTLELPLDLSKEEIEKRVLAHEKTQAQLQGRTPKKVIIVPGKIVNIVG